MEVLFVLYGIIAFFGEMFLDGTATVDVPWHYAWTPKFFHERTHMNWVGCWICSVLINLVMPIGAIYRVIYWLFHI